MKKNTSKTLFTLVVFVALGLFILNPAFAVADCNLVCEGSYVIDNIDTAADLEALSGCTSVTGDLSIECSPLTNLEGLECLTHVDGTLRILDNESLTSLAGLESLKSVGGELYIDRNDSLPNLAGLENLESVGQDPSIEDNLDLCTSLAEALAEQVKNARGIGGDTIIEGNDDC